MRRDEAIAVLAAHQSELREMGVGALFLFGSVARNKARPDSDVDIMVELSRPMGMFKFFGIQEYLEGLLGRKVDLTTTDGLHPRIREQVMNEAVRAACQVAALLLVSVHGGVCGLSTIISKT